ncbi:MAG: hypothetical protein PHW72_02165 [Candidatus Pacebacteria bacterium]|nr:hypothetical protein [Candidatus Paceibacterota bacterium]
MEKNQQEIKKLLEKAERAKKDNNLDLSSEEDLSIAVMNLVSLEEHFFFTGVKTGKDEYYNLLNQVREIRKSLLKRIVKNSEGEVWCISKHLLASSMRLIEVGTKYLKQGNQRDAQDLFAKAYDLYVLFWGLNLKLINLGEVKKVDDDQLDIYDEKRTNLLGKLGEIVKKAIDCCKE